MFGSESRKHMPEALTDSIQDYLKIIYELTEDGEPASTTALAQRLGIAPASVTGMVQKLATLRPALVSYRKHQGVTLTAAGKRAALEVIRHHRLLEAWLVQALGYSWDEVHNEAEKLEHVISEDLEERIASAMGNPTHDPHGEPIPSAELVMPEDDSILLADLPIQQSAVISKVHAQDTDMLRHLDELGLVLGTKVKAIERSRYDEIMRVQVEGQKENAVLGPAVTKRVFIKITE